MKLFIKDFFSKCDQIRRKLRIWSHIQKNFIFSCSDVLFIATQCATEPVSSEIQIIYTGGDYFNAIAKYSCIGNRCLDGNSVRRCQSNGKWSGTNPVCRGRCLKIYVVTCRITGNKQSFLGWLLKIFFRKK